MKPHLKKLLIVKLEATPLSIFIFIFFSERASKNMLKNIFFWNNLSYIINISIATEIILVDLKSKLITHPALTVATKRQALAEKYGIKGYFFTQIL